MAEEEVISIEFIDAMMWLLFSVVVAVIVLTGCIIWYDEPNLDAGCTTSLGYCYSC